MQISICALFNGRWQQIILPSEECEEENVEKNLVFPVESGERPSGLFR